MSRSILNAAHFHDEDAAIAYVEARVWPNGKPVCPHCGGLERIGKLQGKCTRKGVWKCYDCRKPFTVKIGTIFEDSPIALHLWLQAIFLVAASKKGISANQLHRVLGVTLKTAWYMGHRIRLAMSDRPAGLMGSDGGAVEVDETYIGRKPGTEVRPGGQGHKEAVLALVERKGGVRSFHVSRVTGETLRATLRGNVSPKAKLLTDQARWYWKLGKEFASHESVNHSIGEYARGNVHTNTIEGYFSVLKRGLVGVYQHWSPEHMHRYLAEFDFRYNQRAALDVNDTQRADKLLAGVVGKRLTYKTVN
jgi:transposase-like protein